MVYCVKCTRLKFFDGKYITAIKIKYDIVNLYVYLDRNILIIDARHTHIIILSIQLAPYQLTN